MSADIPNTIAPRGNNLTPEERMQALTTYLHRTIEENTGIMNALRTRLEKVTSHFESSLPGQSGVQVDRMAMMSHDLNAISEALSRLDGRIEEEEEEWRKQEMEREKRKKLEEMKEQKPREEKRAGKIKEMKVKIMREEKTKAVKAKKAKVRKVREVKVKKEKEVKVKKEEVKEVKVKMEMEGGKEDTTTATTTTATAATLSGTQLPALEPTQVTLAPVPTAQEGPVGLSGQTGLEAKAQVEMDMEPGNEPENGNQNTVTSSPATAVQTEAQIPPLLTADHSSPGHPAIATSSTPLPITVNKTDTTTTTGEIMKTPPAETPQKARRWSLRILESVQKSAQSLFSIFTTQDLTPTIPRSPSSKTTPKPKSPILKPKPGAGVTKRKTASRTPSQTPPKVKQSPRAEEEDKEPENEPENENQNTGTSSFTTGAQTETQIPPLLTLTADHTSPGHPALAASSTPPPIIFDETDTSTMIEEIMKTLPAETHQEELEAQLRILESVQKSTQNLFSILTTQEGLESTAPRSPSSKTTPKPKSPILKPKPGAGVTKRKTASRTPSQTLPKVKQSPRAEGDKAPENEPEIEDQNTGTSSFTTGVQTETQIPPLLTLTADHTSPGHPAIAASSSPPPIIFDDDTLTMIEEIMKTPPAEPHQEELGAQLRILESMRKSAQNLIDILAVQEGFTPTPSPRPSPSNKTTPKPMPSSPILKPKPGTGVTKTKTPSRTPTPSQKPPKSKKQSPQVEEKVKGEDEKGEKEKEKEKEDNQNQIQNTADTTATTTAKPRRGKTPGKAPQVPQRRSTRIIESAQKKAQAKPLPTIIQPKSPILEPKDGAGVSKRGARGGRGGRGGRGRGRGARGGQGK
ncbi:hypothetical protein B9Z19DRAFT_1110086 [Tuber borchii]|uniref:Uncharacterized protein n=1 Tax=Tuber borchii TaxID=42251 RepID=A0A2T6ZIW4_TUBBO|nr:hypothetical protein B9Z19DRAFT_1110086 [Tuber borchii]